MSPTPWCPVRGRRVRWPIRSQRRPTARSCIPDRSCASSSTTWPTPGVRSVDSAQRIGRDRCRGVGRSVLHLRLLQRGGCRGCAPPPWRAGGRAPPMPAPPGPPAAPGRGSDGVAQALVRRQVGHPDRRRGAAEQPLGEGERVEGQHPLGARPLGERESPKAANRVVYGIKQCGHPAPRGHRSGERECGRSGDGKVAVKKRFSFSNISESNGLDYGAWHRIWPMRMCRASRPPVGSTNLQPDRV